MKNTISRIFFMGSFIALTACGGGSGDNNPPAPTPTPQPIITSFVSGSATITTGTSTNLTAEFTGGTATIDNGVGTVTTGAPVSVMPSSSTTYTLTVTNADNVTVTSNVTITVVAAPSIASFNSSAINISAGNSVNLTPSFSGGSAIIDNGVGSVNSDTSITVTPAANTTYTLTITNAAGDSVSSSVSINVVAKPAITSFTPSATTITVGSSVNLTANFTGGIASIDNNVGNVANSSAISVSPTLTTTYVLTVTNTAGAVTIANLTITVVDAPIISSFTSSLITITAGSSIDLTSVFGNGTGSIDNGVGTVTSSPTTPVSLSPTITTTYTLTVTNEAGDTVVSSLTITVVPEPIITSFTPSITSIIAGDTIDLTAVFSNGTASIDNGVGIVTSGVAASISPSTTTAYTLTVTNSVGATVTYTVIISVNALDLTGLAVTSASLDQVFQSTQADYTATIGFLAQSVTVNATTSTPGATVSVNGVDVDTNNNSGLISLSEGANAAINIVVTSSGGATNSYTLTLTRQAASTFAEQAYVKATNITALDGFGLSVALSGNTLAVGAYNEGSNTTGVNSTANDLGASSGAVYVFIRNGTTWTQQAYIKASNTGAGDYFGRAVALSGDTLAVGAYLEDSISRGINSSPIDDPANSLDSGAVYVFSRSGSTWTQDAYIKSAFAGGPINASTGNHFGYSVALTDNTLAVGARGESSSTTGFNSTQNISAPNSGAVYIFTRTNNVWAQDAYLKPSNTGGGDYFGSSVALSGDLLAVGAIREQSSTSGINSSPNDNVTSAGAAYVFLRSNVTNWNQLAYIKPSNTADDMEFGISVALYGNTLAVGAYREDGGTTGINTTPDTSGPNSGAVYVYTLNGFSWTQQAYIKASNTGAGDAFGRSVAISGDTLVVGANGEGSSSSGINATPNNLANNAGAAYVYHRVGGNWSQTSFVKASNTSAADQFGYSVAISGDTFVAGAYGEDSSTTGINSTSDNLSSQTGAVYVFE